MSFRYLLTLPIVIASAASRGSCQLAQGSVDAAALQRLLRAAEAAHSDAVVVWKDGKKVDAWYFGNKPTRIEAMSATKSIVNLAIGRLVTTGAIRSIDDPVSKYCPEWKQGRKQAITIRQFARSHIWNAERRQPGSRIEPPTS